MPRTLGRCRCVSYRHRQWRGPLCPLSRGHGVVPHSPRPFAQYDPLFSAPLSALDFCSRPHTGPLPLSPLLPSFSGHDIAYPPHAAPFPFLPPPSARARTGSAPRLPLFPSVRTASAHCLHHLHLRCAAPILVHRYKIPSAFTSLSQPQSPSIPRAHSIDSLGVSEGAR
jgi:hypothetical protein